MNEMTKVLLAQNKPNEEEVTEAESKMAELRSLRNNVELKLLLNAKTKENDKKIQAAMKQARENEEKLYTFFKNDMISFTVFKDSVEFRLNSLREYL
jgi:hypothetical protein